MQQYSETIKQHYHHPLNTGKLSHYTHTAEQLNPLCGDEIKVYLNIANGKIKDLRYEARGCMIFMAAASILSEEIKEKTIKKVQKITKEHIEKLLGAKVSPAREQCVLLALNTIKNIN